MADHYIKQAVSVSLPTWASNVGYEEGQDWVVSKMQTGYPRFFVHKSIDRLAVSIVAKHGSSANEKAMLFPSHAPASRCVDFFRRNVPGISSNQLRILDFIPNPASHSPDEYKKVLPRLAAVVYPKEHWPVAKQFWQHSGDGVSSRRAEFCEKAFHDGSMVEKTTIIDIPRMKKGPRRYQRNLSKDESHTQNGHYGQELIDSTDPFAFVEERFGRNLNMQFAARAKLAIRRRIAGSLTADADLHEALQHPEDQASTRQAHGFSVDDVYLYPCGMSAIFNTHRTLMLARPDQGKTLQSISYGFPYVDTLKVLEKFGPGALFYGFGETADIDDLEKRLENGERYLGLFCEFPGNPLLKTPDLVRLRKLADKYDFAIVVDETIGNFLNVNVLPYADVVVSSLTKIFSGDSNVMGGAAILNPQGPYYKILKQALELPADEGGYEDNHFEEDSIFLERNSRDFVERIKRVNVNAEALCDLLSSSSKSMFQNLFLPFHSPLISTKLLACPALTSCSQTSQLPQDCPHPSQLRRLSSPHRRLRRSFVMHIPLPRRRQNLL